MIACITSSEIHEFIRISLVDILDFQILDLTTAVDNNIVSCCRFVPVRNSFAVAVDMVIQRKLRFVAVWIFVRDIYIVTDFDIFAALRCLFDQLGISRYYIWILCTSIACYCHQ